MILWDGVIFVLIIPLAYLTVKFIFRFVPWFSRRPNNSIGSIIEPYVNKKHRFIDPGFLISAGLLVMVLLSLLERDLSRTLILEKV